ncbi:long-chain fatty acid transport protein 4-like, partial [Cryptotermes secundus]|uniref:long-chain fatty acid transport protein 4-like n=1 Tax=Cryptotermes secundus TaxID=105785 RepID=UPI001454CF1E
MSENSLWSSLFNSTTVTVFEISQFFLLLIVAVITLIVINYRRRIYIAMVTLPRDLRIMYGFGKLIWYNRVFQKQNTTVLKLFQQRVAKEPKKIVFYFEDKAWTVADVEEFSNRVAQVFIAAGYRKGDIVALFMGNCPEYICIWLGLAKLGVITSLINHNLRNQPLSHTLNVVKTKALIFSHELSSAVQEVVSSLDIFLEQYQLGGKQPEASNVKSLNLLLASASTSQPNVEGPGYMDELLYIYTSGTTGLPKPALVPHSRCLLVIFSAKCLLQLNPDDIIYNPLPLYHTSGGMIGIGPALVFGNPVALRTKFSASAYWNDCIKYKCTVSMYIGEMCRYIMATPHKPEDSKHCIRMMLGNGMRPTIWKGFMERFKVGQVAEFYGSTEGNANMINLDSQIGAVGCIPRCVPRSLLPVDLIRVDPDTNIPIRDKRGLCIRCDTGEPGMLVGLISSSNAIRDFHGYVDKKASSRKILHNVFKMGDKAFLTGDLLVMDEYGYIYFKDRTGDTFRWKGENVSTAEVESVIINVIGLKDVAVYGVQVNTYSSEPYSGHSYCHIFSGVTID